MVRHVGRDDVLPAEGGDDAGAGELGGGAHLVGGAAGARADEAVDLAARLEAAVAAGAVRAASVRFDVAGTEPGELAHAGDLVELVREVEQRRTASLAGGRLAVGVAAYPTRHPESPSFRHDIEVLLAKQRAGADFAITQVYFRPQRYERLVGRRHAPPLYYAIAASTLLALGAVGPAPRAAAVFAAVALGLVSVLAARRLRGLAKSPREVLDVVLSSFAIPYLSLYWRLRGALRWRVAFF